ncbi:MAG: hypothetical protein PHV28_07720 [Kiritimatiellae bacterium]|nr:hypothetical protein [Kiritimatiellia bacterium]
MFEHTNLVRGLEGLTATDKALLYALASRAEEKGDAYPAIPRLMIDSGIATERTLRQTIKRCELSGVLHVTRKAGLRNSYRLTPCEIAPPAKKHPVLNDSETPCDLAPATPCYLAPQRDHLRDHPKKPCIGDTKKSFKQWSVEDFTKTATDSNNGKLTADELKRFIDYWLEPDAHGKPRFKLKDCFDVRRRLNTWDSKNNGHAFAQRKPATHFTDASKPRRDYGF